MNLDLLCAAVESTPHNVPPEVARWFLSGLAEHLKEGVPMDDALGLRTQGASRNLRTQYLKRLQDIALYEAWSIYGGDDNRQWWKLFSRTVRNFSASTWPRWRDLDDMPEHASALQRSLWRAFKYGNVATSPRRLSEAVKRGSEYMTQVLRTPVTSAAYRMSITEVLLRHHRELQRLLDEQEAELKEWRDET